MRSFPMLVVRDVEASSAWYQALLELKSAHGGPHFEMLMDGERLALTLHDLRIDEHPVIADPRKGQAGRGVLLYFSVEDVAAIYERAVSMEADLVDEPHENENARAIEFSLRDPDGYALTVSEWQG